MLSRLVTQANWSAIPRLPSVSNLIHLYSTTSPKKESKRSDSPVSPKKETTKQDTTKKKTIAGNKDKDGKKAEDVKKADSKKEAPKATKPNTWIHPKYPHLVLRTDVPRPLIRAMIERKDRPLLCPDPGDARSLDDTELASEIELRQGKVDRIRGLLRNRKFRNWPNAKTSFRKDLRPIAKQLLRLTDERAMRVARRKYDD